MESNAAVQSKIECLEPFVMSGCINDWKPIGWTYQRLMEIVKPAEGNGLLRIRLGPKEHVRGKVGFNLSFFCIINVIVIKLLKFISVK